MLGYGSGADWLRSLEDVVEQGLARLASSET